MHTFLNVHFIWRNNVLKLYNFDHREHGWEPSAVENKLKELQEKGVVKAMEHGAFTRVVHQDTQIQVNFI